MIVKVDNDRCTGHARCNAVAPEVYELDDGGYCAITQLSVPVAHEQAARNGAANCPERAISIVD